MLGKPWRTTSGLVVLVALIFALATISIGAVAYETTHEALEEQLDHRTATETAALIAEAHEDGILGLAEAIRRREAARSTASLDYLLLGAAGERLAGNLIAQVPDKEGYEEFLYYRSGDRSGIAQALTTKVAGGTLVVAADRSDLNALDRALVTLFAGALTAMLLAGIGAAALIGWITRRRLARIHATAHAIIDGDMSRRVPRDGSGSEFDLLASTLNDMLDRIAGLMDNLRQVSSDVAHDLRTPLTRLYASLDNAVEGVEPAEKARHIAHARAQAAELLEIFAALLRIAEVEGMGKRLPRRRVDLTSLLEQIVDSYRPDFEESGHHLRSDIAPDLVVNGDQRLLNQAIANLFDNALRHTPPGTMVSLRAINVDGAVESEVSDNGPGVGGNEAGRLFQRFARAEQARTTSGHGLGLALVGAIATAHGGSATLRSDNGFSITIRLPELSQEPDRGQHDTRLH